MGSWKKAVRRHSGRKDKRTERRSTYLGTLGRFWFYSLDSRGRSCISPFLVASPLILLALMMRRLLAIIGLVTSAQEEESPYFTILPMSIQSSSSKSSSSLRLCTSYCGFPWPA